MAELVKDPVCGMEVDPESAAAQSEHEGATYYFCAEACKTQFDADPGRYVGAAPAAEAAPEAVAEAPSKRWWEFWKP